MALLVNIEWPKDIQTIGCPIPIYLIHLPLRDAIAIKLSPVSRYKRTRLLRNTALPIRDAFSTQVSGAKRDQRTHLLSDTALFNPVKPQRSHDARRLWQHKEAQRDCRSSHNQDRIPRLMCLSLCTAKAGAWLKVCVHPTYGFGKVLCGTARPRKQSHNSVRRKRASV